MMKKHGFNESKPREAVTAVAFAALIGVLAGLAATAYRYVLWLMEGFRGDILSIIKTPLSVAALFLGLALIGFIVGKLTEREPLIKGSGIPQVEAQLKGYIEPKWYKVLIAKFIGGALSMFAGLSVGREGPSIQLGAMAGDGAARTLKRTDDERRELIIAGACAGLAAAFNAPLAGIMFALEELKKKMSVNGVLAAMAASLAGDVTSNIFLGTEPALNLENAVPLSAVRLEYLWLYIAMGLALGLFGVLYNTTLAATQKLYSKIKLPLYAKIMIPFLLAGVAALFMPDILGGGHGIIVSLASGARQALGAILILLAAKFAFSMLSFSSGAPGGIFFPLLVLGSLAGAVVFKLVQPATGLADSYMLNFVLLGMSGMFASIVRAPLTGIVLVIEMSGSLDQALGVTVVAAISAMVAQALKCKPVYEKLLEPYEPKAEKSCAE